MLKNTKKTTKDFPKKLLNTKKNNFAFWKAFQNH